MLALILHGSLASRAGLRAVRLTWHGLARALAAMLVLLAGLPAALQAQELQAIPPLSARVIDTTGTLAEGARARLEAKLQGFEQTRGTQIVVLMIPSTRPEDIESYTQRVGDLWKIGRKDVGDGLLVVIAKNDRTLRIAPAKTLEGAVPDLAARQIIQNVITPRFRDGDFAGGIEAGLDQLMALISGEQLPAGRGARESLRDAGVDWTGVLVFLFVAVPIGARVLSAMLGRKLGALATGGAVGALAWVLSASVLLGLIAAVVASIFALASALGSSRRGPWHTGGWGGPGHWGGGGWGGGGGWSGGGGFRSGGGGDFGGGGASGRW